MALTHKISLNMTFGLVESDDSITFYYLPMTGFQGIYHVSVGINTETPPIVLG